MSPAGGLRLADPDASWAVLAGVPHYTHLRDLPQVANNIAALEATLADPRVWGLPSDRITVVKPESVRDGFLTEVGTAANTATDTLVVYYAGHGLPDPQSSELYLGLPMSERGNVEAALRYQFLARRLSQRERTARNIVVILDCCYAGRAGLGIGMSGSEDFADLADIPGSCLIAASAPTETALAPVGATYTAFTGVLLDLLRLGVRSSDQFLSVTTLHHHAFKRLSGGQTPQISTRGAGAAVCFARNADYSPGAAADPAPATADVPAAVITDIVQQRLKHLRRVKGFEPAPLGLPAPGFAARARAAHPLESGEVLLGVWQFRRRVLGPPDSFVFTSHGVRIKDGKDLAYIPYSEIRRYRFQCETTSTSVITGPSTARQVPAYRLHVSGPGVLWLSPVLRTRDDVDDLVAVLDDIQQVPVTTRGSRFHQQGTPYGRGQ